MKDAEIIEKLNRIEKELLLHSSNKLENYNKGEKVHKKQLEFHKNMHRNRWVFGGNRSGKTECGAVETVWLARGIHPFKPNKKDVCGWVVSLSTQVQRDVAQAKIFSYLNKDWIQDIKMSTGRKDSPEFGVVDTIIIKNIFGGLSKIGFKTCDQGREKFQGTSLDFVWFDEEPPLDIYLECRMRVLDKCGEIFGTMTPLKGLSWVYNYIYLNEFNDEDIWYIQMEWADNPYLNYEEIEKYTKTFSESELNSRRYGLFENFGGIVYNEFDPNVHIIEPFEIPKEWQDNLSIDPGLHNPLSCHWYAVDYDENIYVVAEHYEANKDVAYHSKKIKEISKRLNWKTTKNGYIQALIDSAATQKTLASEKNVVDLFYDNGIVVNTKVCKDLYSGINRVKSYLRNGESKPKLFIFKNCVNLIREIKGYFWGNDDVPIKKDDHALDELRYYIMSRPAPPVLKQEKSEIVRNKEMLYRKLKYRRMGYY